MKLRSRYLVISIAVSTIALVCIFYVFTTAVHPGHGDRSHYVNAAYQMYTNGSFYVDYIWNFFGDFYSVRKFSFSYWLPGVSIFQYLGYSLFGDHLWSALMPSLILSIFTYVLSTLMYFDYTGDTYSSLLYSVSAPHLFILIGPTNHLQTNGYILCLGIISFFVRLNKGKYEYYHFYLTVLLSVSALVRNDWFFILLPILALDIYDYANNERVGSNTFYYLCIPALISLAWSIFFGAQKAKVILFTEYSDLYKLYLNDITLSRFIGQGLWEILAERLRSVYDILSNKYILFLSFSAFVTSPFLVGSINSKLDTVDISTEENSYSKYTEIYLITASFIILCVLFYGFVAPLFGAWTKSIKIGWAFLMGSTFINLSLLKQSFKKIALLIIVVMSLLLYSKHFSNDFYYFQGENMSKKYQQICNKVRSVSSKKNPVVMTRQVWELSYSCDRINAVQVPSDGMSALKDISERMNADLLLIESGWLNSREYLYPIWRNKSSIAGSKGYKIYTIEEVISPNE